MICYRDQTFCTADDCAKFESCDRALTDEVRADAARLDLPMSVVDRMPCFETKQPHTCKYCGAPSWLDPVDQCPPSDYCHESDHGEPEP